jgi:hypothetical protein
MAHEINKILEIDMDTERDGQLEIRQVSGGSGRKRRPPDPSTDLLDNFVILVNALGATILAIEARGLAVPGAAMRKAVDQLQEVYVDASCEISQFRVDKTGNRIPKKSAG